MKKLRECENDNLLVSVSYTHMTLQTTTLV